MPRRAQLRWPLPSQTKRAFGLEQWCQLTMQECEVPGDQQDGRTTQDHRPLVGGLLFGEVFAKHSTRIFCSCSFMTSAPRVRS